MAIEYIGGSSGQNDWGNSHSITPTATEAQELWVVLGWSTWGSPGITLDSAAVNDAHSAGNGYGGCTMGWKIVGAGSHTAAVSGSDSVAVAVMRFRGFKSTPYLDYTAEVIAYGTEAPFPNADLTALAGGMACGGMFCADTWRGYYISSGGTVVGAYTTRTPCDGQACLWAWGYKIPTISSSTEHCQWTQDSYTTEGQGGVSESFAPGGGAPQVQVI
jgi:hypothetical protein